MPASVLWWVLASCQAPDLDALANACTRPGAHYDGDDGVGAGLVHAGFHTASPTLTGIAVEGRAAVARVVGELVTGIDVLSVTRAADGAVFAAEDLASH